MNTIKKHLQLFSLVILVTFFFNFSSSPSIVGDFSTDSSALATHQGVPQSRIQEAAFPALLLGALAGVVVVAAFVVGFVDGWNCGPITMANNNGMDIKYQKMDFSKFDI